jgi:hypothetical protein
MAWFRRKRETSVTGADRVRGPIGAPRAVATLAGAAAAGLLIWLATQVGDSSTGGYWAQYGLVAAAGLTMALSQLLGGWTKWGMPRISTTVFVIGFLPVLIVGGWILLAHQPDANWFRSHVLNWSGDIGVRDFVDGWKGMLPALSFGIGLTFGFSFDTTGPRIRHRPGEIAGVDEGATEEPLTAERTVHSPDGDHVAVGTTATPRTTAPPPDDTA